MRKFLATLLALAMALSLMVPAAWAEPADEPASATYEAVLGKTARKYGNIELDISTEKFMKAGFAYGDVVTVDVNGNSYEMPVCSNYNDVDTGKKLVRATEGASSVIVAINYGQLAVDAGLAKPNTDPAVSDKYVAADGVTYPVKVTITMKDKGAYFAEWDARQLPQRTGDRNADMYKNLTDAEFANVRVIETTGMGEGVLYRGSSPINDAVEGRNPYADAAAKAAGIKTFINLADSEAAAKAYPGWEGSYYSTQDAVFLNMPVAFTTDAFKTGLANGYRYIASSETEAPYYMHCTEGKDRCGIASAVLECFMGASYDEVVADYLVTYYNYYGIQPGTEKAANIAKYGIVSALQTMFGVEDLSKADLQAEALDYLLEIGLNAEEIVSLLLTLSGLPASLEGLVVILHSNDVHGNIMGYAQMAALRDAFESLGAEVILADAGDYSQGTTYVSTTKGADAIEMMNVAGYDVATLGNHEFDYGYPQLKENLSKADFAVLCANILKDGENAFQGNTIIEKDGVKIGFFGLDTPEAQTKANPALMQGLSFYAEKELYACAQAQIDELRANGADIVVCLAHLGVDKESAPNRSTDLYANVTGLDFIIDGHSHTVMVEGADGEPIQSTGTAFEYVGMILIDSESKEILGNALVELDGVAGDPTVAAAAQKIIDRVNAEYGEVFARSDVELNGDKAPGNRTEETNLGDLITDAMLWSLTEQNPGSITEVDPDNIISLTNGGGIRAWIHQGDISKKDINTVLPFGNTVAVVYVTGAELLEALEASTFSTPGAVGAFPQVAGIDFTIFTDKAYDANTDKYPGSTYYGPHSIQRVVINSINGKPFDLNAKYAVITNNFVAAGGDTYYAFAAASSQFDTGRPLDEVLMEYITEKLGGVVGEQYAEPQGRITIANCTEGSHDFRLVNAKAATCGDDGYTGDVVCAGCGEVQSKGAVIKATGEHHYDKGVCTVCGAKDPNYKLPTTGDSGVLLYVGLAVMAIGGSAVVVTRKKERT